MPAADLPSGDGVASARTTRLTRRLGPLREFVATENASAVVLLAATVAALAWANSPWSSSYERLWTTEIALRVGHAELSLDLREWVNDALMAFFFFVVGLEIRREFDMGELRERRRVAIPVLAAIGGMAVPAAIYLAFNAGTASGRGWGIVMGTDTAFALGVLTLVGGAAPRVRAFLLTLVIVDDVVALTVVAVAYTDQLDLPALAVALGMFGLVVVLKLFGVHHGVPYFLVGAGVWLATLASGVHATVAGVVMGLLASAYPPSRGELHRASTVWRLFREEPTPSYARSVGRTLAEAISPNQRLQYLFHSWTSYLIVPLFALANAGVELDGGTVRAAASSPITIGIVVGLVTGKVIGITGASWLASRRWLGRLPLTLPWPPLVGVSVVAGIGFTVSLLIAHITFEGRELDEAKIGILSASVVASVLAWLAFRVVGRLPQPVRAAGLVHVAPPIRDLSEPVDPAVDHLRGPEQAPLTLVEYGDFECPHCGRAEPVVREVARSFGDDLAFVFRHLPLTDVHEHAELAAEASEAAAAQRRFWEMHDALFAWDGPLDTEAIFGIAERIGLDVARLDDDLQARRHVLRVARDVASADDSGAAGTPTFFINGRRYEGAPDVASLTAALRRELVSLEGALERAGRGQRRGSA